MASLTRTVRLTVIAADGLVKKDLFFKMPDPFGNVVQLQLALVAYLLTSFLL